jgi:hypothetical protein
LPTLRLTEAGVRRARAGQALSRGDFVDEPGEPTPAGAAPSPAMYAWVDSGGLPVALGVREGDLFRVRRGFAGEREVTTL